MSTPKSADPQTGSPYGYDYFDTEGAFKKS